MSKKLLTISVIEDDDGNLVGETSGAFNCDGETNIDAMAEVATVLACLMATTQRTIDAMADNLESANPGIGPRFRFAVEESARRMGKKIPLAADVSRVAVRFKE